jgi:putative membrane protein
MLDAVVAYFHFVGIMSLLAALVAEHMLLGGELDVRRGRQLAATDRVYWCSAAIVLVSGLLRMTWFGKGMAFYAGNPLFHAKMAVFVLVIVLSIYPGLKFLDVRRSTRDGLPPRLPDGVTMRLKMLLRMELAAVILIPLLAVAMARGFGY